jgi:hypothetical protein
MASLVFGEMVVIVSTDIVAIDLGSQCWNKKSIGKQRTVTKGKVAWTKGERLLKVRRRRRR